MGLYENVKEAAKNKGYSINRLEKELGFARSYIGKFKTITPGADKIKKIADFLDVSSEYLLTGKEKETTPIFKGDFILTYETIKKLCKEKGVTVTGVENELGFSRGSLSKADTSKPSMEKVQKIADFFNVSIEYLMGSEEKEESHGYYINEETAKAAQEIFENKELRMLFDAARDADPEDLRALHNMALALKRKERGYIDDTGC